MFVPLLLLVLLVVVIALFARGERLAARVRQLENRLSLLEDARGIREAPAAPPSPLPATRPASIPPPPPSTPPPPSRTREEWEALIGGKLLNRIGALALIVGMGFFLKHAFDENWITEAFRVILGGAIGAGLLILADRARRRDFAVFAQGLVGAGIAILYLSVYASFNYYSLVSQPVAFVLMSAVTLIAFTQAFRYDSLAVALIGWLGGFLTPILLSTGTANEIGLFSYLLLLDIGIIAVTRAKGTWTVLEPLAVFGTWAFYFLWWIPEYRSDAFTVTLLFLLLFWGGFHALDILLSLQADTGSRFRRAIGWGNAFLATVALSLLVGQTYPTAQGLTFLLFAAAYAGSAALFLRRRDARPSAFLHFALAGGILLACAIIAEETGFRVPTLLLAEAILLLFLGARLAVRPLRIAGEILVAAGAIVIAATTGAFTYYSAPSFIPIWNERALMWLFLAAGCAVAARLRREAGESIGANVATYGWIVSLLILLTVELSDTFLMRGAEETGLALNVIMFHRILSIALAWSAAGFFLMASGRTAGSPPLAAAGTWILLAGSAIAAFRGILLVPLEAHVPLANFRSIVFILITLAFLFAIPILRELRSRAVWYRHGILVFQMGAAMMVFLLITAEIANAFGKALADLGVRMEEDAELRDQLRNMKQLALSGGWLLYSSALMVIGLVKRLRSLRVMAIALFGLTTLKVVLFDLSFLELAYRYISFIALGIILLTASYLYRRYREIITEPSAE